MLQTVRRTLTVAVCSLLFSTATLLLWHLPGGLRAEDRNRDGRPDFWQSFDRVGHLASVSVDTNFDGRSDLEEFYEAGALVRRQADRDFNDRIDLIQTFDPATRDVVRSLTDVNGDGVADLLVLFSEGEPVFTKWADRSAGDLATASVAGHASDGRPGAARPLLPLDDPFSGDLAIKQIRAIAAAPDVTSSALAGMPELRREGSELAAAPHPHGAAAVELSSPDLGQFSPRAPPART
jgi:hypothetical protein